jgi:hypothetical protein
MQCWLTSKTYVTAPTLDLAVRGRQPHRDKWPLLAYAGAAMGF